MFHLRKFDTYRDYKDYLLNGDIYLPRVTLIINAGDNATSVDPTNSEYGPTWLDFSKLGEKFVQIANDGTMIFTNQYTVDNLFDYVASVNEQGGLELHVYYTGTTNELTSEDTQYYDKYAIKTINDKLVFPALDRVSKGDVLLEENLFYLEDIAKLNDPNFHLG